MVWELPNTLAKTQTPASKPHHNQIRARRRKVRICGEMEAV